LTEQEQFVPDPKALVVTLSEICVLLELGGDAVIKEIIERFEAETTECSRLAALKRLVASGDINPGARSRRGQRQLITYLV